MSSTVMCRPLEATPAEWQFADSGTKVDRIAEAVTTGESSVA